MSMDQLQKLVDKRNELWAKMTEVAGRSGLDNAEDMAQYKAIETDLDTTVEPAITALEGHMERDKAFADRKNVVPTMPTDEKVDEAKRYAGIFDKWLRHGISELDTEERTVLAEKRQIHEGSKFEIRGGISSGERRALSSLQGQAGGFTVPDGFWNTIQEARKAFGGLRNGPTFKLETSQGNDLPIPTSDDTGIVGTYVGENTLIGEQDLGFDQKVLKAFTITSKIIRVPVQLLQDSAFDIESYVARKLGERIGRGEAAKFVTGTGLDQPEGIVTAAPVGYTATGTNTLAYADFVNLIHSVDVAYRSDPSTALGLSDSALKTARLITVSSSDSRPLWQPSMLAGIPNTILGENYFVDNGFAAVLTGAKPMAFGAWQNFWIRDVKGVQLLRLDERYAEYLQVGFLAFARNDSKLIDAGQGPIKTLLMA